MSEIENKILDIMRTTGKTIEEIGQLTHCDPQRVDAYHALTKTMDNIKYDGRVKSQ